MGSKSTTWIILAAIGGILIYLWVKKSTPASAAAPGTSLVRNPIGARQNPLLCTIARLLGKKCKQKSGGASGGGGSAPSHCAGSGPAAGQKTCCKSSVSPCCYCPCAPGTLPFAPSAGTQLNGLAPPACPQCGIAGCCNLVASATTSCCSQFSNPGGGSVGGCFCCSSCFCSARVCGCVGACA
jgi:hypothetical protein